MTNSEAIENTKSYLTYAAALQSIERDPYWPKWDSPWWHMSLLNEMDLAKEIPKSAVSKMVQVLKNHYHPVFPIKEEEVPTGTDPYRKIACLCAVGNMYQVLFNAGVDVDTPKMMRAFAEKRQLNLENWFLLSGKDSEIKKVTKVFQANKDVPSRQGDEFVHSENVFLLDSKGYLRGVYNVGSRADMDLLVKDAQALN